MMRVSPETIDYPLHITSLPPHHCSISSSPTILLLNPSNSTISLKTVRPPQPSGKAAPWSQRKDSWASPMHFLENAEQCAYRTATKFRAEVQREAEQKLEWSSQRRTRRAVHQLSLRVRRQALSPSKGLCSAAKRQRYQIGSHGNPLRGSSDSGTRSGTIIPVGLAHENHDDDGSHPDVSPRSVAAVVLHEDLSAASSELWTRFVTRAVSCRLALRQLFLSNCGSESRRSHST